MSRDDLPKRKNSSLTSRLARKALGQVYKNIEDTVVPRTEDFIVDLFTSIVDGLSGLINGAFQSLIYQDDDREYRPRGRRRGQHEYDEYYERKRRRNRNSPSVQRKEKKDRFSDIEDFTDGLVSRKNWNEIVYDNRKVPERLLRRLQKDAAKYDGVRMETLYEYLKMTGGDYTETYLGWKNLDHARVVSDGPGRFWLRLPEPVDMDLVD